MPKKTKKKKLPDGHGQRSVIELIEERVPRKVDGATLILIVDTLQTLKNSIDSFMSSAEPDHVLKAFESVEMAQDLIDQIKKKLESK